MPAITIGTTVGSYEILSLVGKGGMGEVYRAKDRKLKREVAIKVLPDEFSLDHDRVSRFQREAEVLASLNHPNIAAIYDLAAHEQAQLLVLELVGGETLAELIARGRIPVEEALTIAKQIAEALEAAHEKGVIHRDLKPANIKITSEGKVKVLDFGLAKVRESSATSNLSNSPTLMTAATSGVILGTAAYMSPEQAKGKVVDRATDVWAFGCVLYEMLTGSQVFQGETVGEILAGIFKSEPDWSHLPADTPAEIRKLLRRCLQKDTSRRFRDAGDVRIEIEEALKEPAALDSVRTAASSRNGGYWIAATVMLAIAFASITALYLMQKPATAPEMRLEITTPPTLSPLEFALSPDGRYIAFVASGDGPQRLWLRALDKADAQPMAGTDGAHYPFWSANSRSIGFFSTDKLKRIDIAGGAPQLLANVSGGRGGTWNADGTILFVPNTTSPVSRIAASGGEPIAVTKLEPQRQTGHRFPQFLPDGHHFLFYSTGSPEAAGIYLGSLDEGEPKRLTAADSAGAYLGPGMVVFIRQTVLMAQHLDLKRGELTGNPVTLADPVGLNAYGGGFSTSADGRLAYRSGSGELHQLMWYDRRGKPAVVASAPDSDNLSSPELSPDGQRVAVNRNVQNNIDIFLMDLMRGATTRFTFDPAIEAEAVWSGDGLRIAFRAIRQKGIFDLYAKPSSGTGNEELLLETPNFKIAHDWSKDGRFLLYSERDPKTVTDLWALPMTGDDRKPIAIVKTPFREYNGQFSPDGHWVAYETDESGRLEVVVQAFPAATGKWQVSTDGGAQPRWRGDGKELYFIAPDGKMMAAPIAASDTTFATETPVALFPTRLPTSTTDRQQYAVSRDGRFLLNQLSETSNSKPITLILNWHPKDTP